MRWTHQTMTYAGFNCNTKNLGKGKANFLWRTFQQKGSEMEMPIIISSFWLYVENNETVLKGILKHY